jgi:uncharacterized membrane protein
MSQGMPQPHSYFGDHFSPVYFLILPFYALFPHPQTLLLFQAAAMALGAVPIYLLARALFPGTAQPSLWVAAYFLFLPVAHITLYDFHEVAFAVLPLGLALYLLERGRVGWFLAALGASILVKEEMALVAAGFGVYALLAKRRRLVGAATAVGSLTAFLVILYAVIPGFSGGHAYPYFALRYGDLGDSPLAVLRTIVTRPGRLLRTVAQARKGAFLAGILGPVLGLPLLSGLGVILLLPALGYLLLSSYEPEYSFTKQYAAPLIPLVLGTAVLGLARIPPRWRSLVSAGVLLSSLTFAYLYGNLPFSRRFDFREFLPEARYSAFAPALGAIPADASVAAENDLTPHLDQRERIYGLEYEPLSGAEYVALDDAALGHDPSRLESQVEAIRAQGYQVVASGPGLALLRRISP